jgi:hypothetical protein
MNYSSFCDVTRCSSLKVNRHFGGTCRLHLQDSIANQERNKYDADITLLDVRFMIVSSLAYFSALKMEAKCSIETSFDFQRTTKLYVLKGRIFLNCCCDNRGSSFLTYILVHVLLIEIMRDVPLCSSTIKDIRPVKSYHLQIIRKQHTIIIYHDRYSKTVQLYETFPNQPL